MLFLLVAAIGLCDPARAQIGSDRYSSLVIDAQSGQVISSANPDEYRFPASLTKMMTMFMVFEAIRDGRLGLNDPVPVSSWAASMPPTKLGLVPGTSLTVEQALLGLVTKSANDAAAALGELLGGDEDRFAQMMTVRARAIGMSRTTFRNASGLPDWGQVTTARDLVLLARRLIQDFPQFYHYFSTPSFVFHRRVVPNHQALLRTYAGADGLKTGYTEASGYNVVTSAMRGDTRLIGVVLGASNGWERDQHMAALLDQGFLRLGVTPMEIARRPPSFRVPGLIGTAQAAPVIMQMPPQAEPAPQSRWGGARPLALRRAPVIEAAPVVKRRNWPMPPREATVRRTARSAAERAPARNRSEPPRAERRLYLPGRSPG